MSDHQATISDLLASHCWECAPDFEDVKDAVRHLSSVAPREAPTDGGIRQVGSDWAGHPIIACPCGREEPVPVILRAQPEPEGAREAVARIVDEAMCARDADGFEPSGEEVADRILAAIRARGEPSEPMGWVAVRTWKRHDGQAFHELHTNAVYDDRAAAQQVADDMNAIRGSLDTYTVAAVLTPADTEGDDG